ncbi:hypothetical protein MYK68_16065 [Gordonia sp. PP30]|uniref:hypothetical protein n=1 Tax=Gordonia sp. PP30 TaxID=2935861 RepID=UPI001FFE90F1|nr:hypothetical protein [Gordonia sp. PP30]UQE74227.1 hypothetical protein MYK68_16065 [Gordonia sp. PP30]
MSGHERRETTQGWSYCGGCMQAWPCAHIERERTGRGALAVAILMVGLTLAVWCLIWLVLS